jgi:hypothetical protein
MTWVFPPDDEGAESKDSAAFRRNLRLSRDAATAADYMALGFTEIGAQAMADQREDGAELPTGEKPTPASRHPSPYRRIALCLSEATPTFDDLRRSGAAAVDRRRVKAVRELHAFYKRWASEAREVEAAGADNAAIETALQQRRAHWIALGAPPDFDRALRDFFERAGRSIFSNPDPKNAMRIFWEGAPLRGRTREDNAERDLDLAIAVQERVYAGSSKEKAIYAVAEITCLSAEVIHKIYYRRMWDAIKAVAWPEFVKSRRAAKL